MKLAQTASWLLGVSIILTVLAASAVEEDSPTTVSTAAQPGSETHVTLEDPVWETVLDRLFGTPDSGGLLDGTRSFDRAEGLTLTAEDRPSLLPPLHLQRSQPWLTQLTPARDRPTRRNDQWAVFWVEDHRAQT
jgi:hypothetical protein